MMMAAEIDVTQNTVRRGALRAVGADVIMSVLAYRKVNRKGTI